MISLIWATRSTAAKVSNKWFSHLFRIRNVSLVDSSYFRIVSLNMGLSRLKSYELTTSDG